MKHSIFILIGCLSLGMSEVQAQNFALSSPYKHGVEVIDKSGDISETRCQILDDALEGALNQYLVALSDRDSALCKTVGPMTARYGIHVLKRLSLTVHVISKEESVKSPPSLHELPQFPMSDLVPYVMKLPDWLCQEEQHQLVSEYVALRMFAHLINGSTGYRYDPESADNDDFIEENRRAEYLTFLMSGRERYMQMLNMHYEWYLESLLQSKDVSERPMTRQSFHDSNLRTIGVDIR